jgi:hypothetical protein
MILDEVKYVNNFPQTFVLQNNVDTDLNIIGINNFIIYDSLLILFTKEKHGFWSFVSLSDYNRLGNFLSIGQGPFEFLFSPTTTQVKLFKEEDQLYASIYDFQKGKLFKMDIDRSITTRKLHISIAQDVPPFSFNFLMIDSLTFFCKEVNFDHTQQTRYILDKDHNRITPDFLQKLNQASIRAGEDVNILTTITKLHSDNNLIVEAPVVGLRYINTYSLDGSFGKTICMGNKLEDINEVQDINEWERLETYKDLRMYADFWGVLCIDEDKKTYQMGRKKLPSIFLFDWQGEPLAELKLNRFITSFDIDFVRGYLYTLDVHSDEFYKYDIKDILVKLKQTNK